MADSCASDLGIHASWVGLGVFVTSAFLALFARAFSGVILNEIFNESPAFFPVAHGVGTYFGVVLGFIAAIAFLLIGLLMIFLSFATLSAIVRGAFGSASSRSFLRSSIVVATLMLAAVATISSLGAVERVAKGLVIQVAFRMDFFVHHRCNSASWPPEIQRVAFIGDEQVLGYDLSRQTVIVLPCERVGF